MRDIIARCEAKGLRMTDQRRIVARVIGAAEDHPDVEELYNRASAIDPRISIATVYRTVKLFEEAGILDRHDFGDGRARYEAAPEAHHDHLIDVETGKVIEFVDPELEALQKIIAEKLGFRLVDHRMEPGEVLSVDRRRLVGAYFTQEYAVEGAALFNPSMVAHPDQSGLDAGSTRFLMTLRAVGEGHISAQSVVEKLVGMLHVDEDVDDHVFEVPTRPRSANSARANNSGVLVRGDADVMVKLARCCTPVPGDEIIGWVTRGSGVSVHRADCRNVVELKNEPERMMEVSWADNSKSLFLVQIQIEALDRNGLLSDVTRVLSEHHVNILSASVSTRSDRVALSRFVFEIGDPTLLDHLLNAVRRIDAVYDVYRVTQ